jgi:hypothetical protein
VGGYRFCRMGLGSIRKIWPENQLRVRRIPR